jgi:hypothetical protein
MTVALQVLAVYALVCMVITARTMFHGFGELVDNLPPGTRYGVFVAGLIYVVLISPFQIPVIVVKTVRELWQEIKEQCRSSGGDHP